MDPKLAILFLLIASIIGLSHLDDRGLGRLRDRFAIRRWRTFGFGRRRS